MALACEPALADRRRADHRPRYHDPGGDHGSHRRTRRLAEYGDAVDHPRSRPRCRILQPHRGDACRPPRRAGADPAVVCEAAPSLHRQADRGDPRQRQRGSISSRRFRERCPICGAPTCRLAATANVASGRRPIAASRRCCGSPPPMGGRSPAGTRCDPRHRQPAELCSQSVDCASSTLLDTGCCLGRRKAQRSLLHAVDGVDFVIGRGETVGLVGESGCGKSTLVRLLARLIDPTAGTIRFDGAEIGAVPARKFGRSRWRADIQMVFQDASDSLNPRFTADRAIADPLVRLRGIHGTALRARVAEAARLTGLPSELLSRFPHQLSGGQKARVGIARAIAVEPRLLMLDEPTSALDVSVQMVILKLLHELKERLDLSYLFVSHDLNVVRLLCDRVLVMYLGRIIESGPAAQIFTAPAHPYTQALLSAIPRPGARGTRIALSGRAAQPDRSRSGSLPALRSLRARNRPLPQCRTTAAKGRGWSACRLPSRGRQN